MVNNYFECIKAVYLKTDYNHLDMLPASEVLKNISFNTNLMPVVTDMSTYLYKINKEIFKGLVWFGIPKHNVVPRTQYIKGSKVKENILKDCFKKYYNWSDREVNLNWVVASRMFLENQKEYMHLFGLSMEDLNG